MQTLFDNIKRSVIDFIGQRNDVTLVVRCSDGHTPPIGKAFEEVEDAAVSEMFWIHVDDFTETDAYVSAVINTFASKHAAVRLAMQQRGMAPWPEFPESLFDETTPPAARLRDLMAFSRGLLPVPDGMTAVWCLFPFEIGDHAAWAELVAAVVQHEFPRPWCHHLRFIVRDDAAGTPVAIRLAGWQRVRHYSPDLSDAAIQRAMEDEADDESRPIQQRLQTLFLLANMDHANRRYDDALAKYDVLLPYYTTVRDPTMAALVLNAMGETHGALGNTELASQCFELAWEPAAAAAGPPVPVMLNVVLNLANLRVVQQRWDEAEGFFHVGQQFATLQRAPLTKVQCLETLGVCQYMQGKADVAAETWQAGAHVAGALDLHEQRRSILERLKAHYQQVQDGPRYWEVVRHLADLPATPVA